MIIEVEAWRRHRHEDIPAQVTQASFTFVAIDADRHPRAVDAMAPGAPRG